MTIVDTEVNSIKLNGAEVPRSDVFRANGLHTLLRQRRGSILNHTAGTRRDPSFSPATAHRRKSMWGHKGLFVYRDKS